MLSAHHRLIRRILSNAGILLFGNVIGLVVGLVQGIVLARYLGPGDLGIFALVTTLTATVNLLLDSRVWETAITFITKFREEGNPAKAAAIVKLCYAIDLAAGLVGFLVVFSLADTLAHALLKDDTAAPLIRLFSVSLLLGVPVGTSSALLRIADRFRWLASLNAGISLLKLVLVLIVVAAGGRLHGILVAVLGTSLVHAVLLFIVSTRAAVTLDLPPWHRQPVKLLAGQYRRVLGFAGYSNLVATSRMITSRADTLILGWLASPADVGVYRLARTISDPLTSLIGPLLNAMYPEFSSLAARRDFVSMRALPKTLSLGIGAIILPVCIFFTVTVGPIVPLLFGGAYTQAAPLAQIMVWQLVWTLVSWVPPLLLALEKNQTLTLMAWADALAYLILLSVLVPIYGSFGAAVATLIRFILWTVSCLLTVDRMNRVDLARQPLAVQSCE
jgi:O-antigen/teichoic acid export membrane protein